LESQLKLWRWATSLAGQAKRGDPNACGIEIERYGKEIVVSEESKV